MSKLFLSVLLRYFLRHNKPEATCQGNGFPLAQPPVLHLILLSIRFDLVLYAYYAYYAYNGYLSVMLFTSAIALSLSLSSHSLRYAHCRPRLEPQQTIRSENTNK